MPTLAETMFAAALDSSDPSKANNTTQAFASGAAIAQHAEQIKQQQQQIEMQKEQVQQAKLEKFVTAVEKGQQYAGKAQSNYYNKFLPAYKKTLGPDIDKMIPDDSLAFVTQSPENIGKFHTLVANVKDGTMSAQEAIRKLNDPIEFADVTPDMFKAVNESQKEFLGNQTRIASANISQTGQNQRQQTDINTAGQVEVKKKAADEFTKYQAIGGSASMDKAEAALETAIAKLKNEQVKTGNWTEKVPYGSDPSVLKRVNPQLSALRDSVLSTQNIKALSGDPNPTEKQIQNIQSYILDPMADPQVNIDKLQAELSRIQMERKQKEDIFVQQGFMGARKAKGKAPAAAPTAPKTYSIGGAERTADEAKAFYSAHPEFLKDKPQLKKELGL